MKKLLAALLLYCSTALGVEPDKIQHAAGSAAIVVVTSPFFANSDHPVLYPFLTAMAIGVAKEIYDTKKKNPTGFNMQDLAADAVGAGVACFVITIPF